MIDVERMKFLLLLPHILNVDLTICVMIYINFFQWGAVRVNWLPAALNQSCPSSVLMDYTFGFLTVTSISIGCISLTGNSILKRKCLGATSARFSVVLVQESNCVLGNVSRSICHRTYTGRISLPSV